MTAIDDKYAALGGSSGFLGTAVGPESIPPDGVGRYRHYQFGSIYWHPAVGAHEVHGAIRGEWESLGWETSFLGYPATDETSTPDTIGRFNHFQGGSIYWTPATGAHEVHGAIHELWSSLGWELSQLGYPTSDELDTPHHTGRVSHFQYGSIYWDSGRGAYEVFPRPTYPPCSPGLRGQWEIPPYNSGVAGLHAALFHTNKVLFFAYAEPVDPENPGPVPSDFGECRTLDLDSHSLGTPTYSGLGGSTQMVNVFCGAHAFLADGRLFVAGGDRETQERVRSAHIFTSTYEPTGGSWLYVATFASGRWYPTCVTLPDGRVLVAGGDRRLPDPMATRNTSYQIFDSSSGGMEPEVAASAFSAFEEFITFPFGYVLPNHKLLLHGGTRTVFLDLTTWSFDPVTLEAAPRPDRNARTYGLEGTSVLLPLMPDSTPPYRARVMMIGGGSGFQIRSPATASCEVLDTSATPLQWQLTAPLAHARVMPDAVLLPDGKVFVTSGSSRGFADNGANPVWEAELYDPATNSWSTACEASVPRLYHSTALLLPDGRVMTAGTDVLFNPDPFHESEKRLEFFSPPYLFQGPRPTIGSAPASTAFGGRITIATPDAATVDRVAILRCGSSTHSFNSDQRYVGLTILKRKASAIDVELPPDGFVAPPGYYMLFLVRQGVPSVGRFMRLDRFWLPKPPYLIRVWLKQWLIDPYAGHPLPEPIDPESCPACGYILVRRGRITSIRLDRNGKLVTVGINHGQVEAYDVGDSPTENPAKIERVLVEDFRDTPGATRITEADGSVRGLVLLNGQVRALIGGVGRMPRRGSDQFGPSQRT